MPEIRGNPEHAKRTIPSRQKRWGDAPYRSFRFTGVVEPEALIEAALTADQNIALGPDILYKTGLGIRSYWRAAWDILTIGGIISPHKGLVYPDYADTLRINDPEVAGWVEAGVLVEVKASDLYGRIDFKSPGPNFAGIEDTILVPKDARARLAFQSGWKEGSIHFGVQNRSGRSHYTFIDLAFRTVFAKLYKNAQIPSLINTHAAADIVLFEIARKHGVGYIPERFRY